MPKRNEFFRILAAIGFLLAGFTALSLPKSFSQTIGTTDTENRESVKQKASGFGLPTLYWAIPRPVAATEWHAVLGGTVIKVKKEKQELSEDLNRKYVAGALKIEKVFLDLPDGKPLSIGEEFYGEGFEDLKKGDKVIVFVNNFYEREFVRIAIDGTNSALGFKVKNWNEPIVAVLEKAAACGKIEERQADGHGRDFRAKFYDCRAERDKMILENADVWRLYDPKGLDEMLERQKFENEDQSPVENQ